MDPGLLTTLTHQAMATEFAVLLPACNAEASDAVLEALEMLDGIESRLTVYRDESEVSQINRRAADEPVEVSPEVFGILKRAVYWSEKTNGAFDITAGPLVDVWGFTKRTGKKPDDEEISLARERSGYQKMVLDESNRTVSFSVEGMAINLGGIGKGYALDQLASTLIERGVENFLVHGGQSSIIARGDQSPGSGLGWAVGISHPTKPRRRVAGIWLRNGSLGTSGSGKQFFHHQGRRYGHVIDPRTGYPAGDLLSLTVLSSSAADADASCTGYFVAGSQAMKTAMNTLLETSSANPCDGDALGPMLAIRAGQRQDAVELQAYGEFHWVEDSPWQGDASSP
jgi:thiamine biosynthesis lipoprotein